MSDTSPIKSKKWKVLILLTLFIAPAAIFYFMVYAGVHKVNRLKFYGPKTVTYKTERGAQVPDTVYHEIPAFQLNKLMEAGQMPYSSKNLSGKLYLAHFLNKAKLAEMPKEIIYAVSEIIPEYPDLVWITFWENSDSARFDYINPSDYTRKFEGKGHQWIELTGNDRLIQSLKTNAYFAKDSADEAFDPSSVVLIDKEGRIRSYFNPVMQAEVSNIKKEILLLYKEYDLAYKTHRFIEFNDEERIRNTHSADTAAGMRN